jgi:YD repeat-containing protein
MSCAAAPQRTTRTATGRVSQMVTETASGSFAFTYDYAGRLRNATSVTGVPGCTQNFQYNRAGSMTNNGRVGAHAYGSAKPRHAPVTVTKGGNVTTLAYDANGNMTAGLDGKAMTCDGENRPLSVTRNGRMTCYVYGADGARLKKIENMAPAASCTAAPTARAPVRPRFAVAVNAPPAHAGEYAKST